MGTLSRVVLALLIALTLAARPSLWPYVAIGALIVLMTYLWVSGRRRAVGALAIAGTVVAAVAVIAGGTPSGEPATGINALGGHPGFYDGHLELAGARDLQIAERLDIVKPPRPVRAALAAGKWKLTRQRGDMRRYRRSATHRIDVGTILPPQRTIYFVPAVNRASSLGSTAPEEQDPDLSLVSPTTGSRVRLDAPPRAIAETFPEVSATSGPGDAKRYTLLLEDNGEPLEFAVRSPWFRFPPLATAADWAGEDGVGALLTLGMTLLVGDVRDFLWGWLKRRLKVVFKSLVSRERS